MIVGDNNITKQAEFDRLAGELAAEDPQWYRVGEAHDLSVWTDALCIVKTDDFEAWHTVSLSPKAWHQTLPHVQDDIVPREQVAGILNKAIAERRPYKAEVLSTDCNAKLQRLLELAGDPMTKRTVRFE
ncbi:hypothetical protein [Bifidobacterium bifidum]|uniref:hypothetical protein n=1 Tax=Bifidobacterium bifidum TaxID=1681 RepID=UPI0006426A3B|nr:hypothetical protein [Bifidobacterium bifidum]KLN81663.1 hypothetical protein B0085_1716 [Bifidobacterium bifidum]